MTRIPGVLRRKSNRITALVFTYGLSTTLSTSLMLPESLLFGNLYRLVSEDPVFRVVRDCVRRMCASGRWSKADGAMTN
jgi:hypothetical protein